MAAPAMTHALPAPDWRRSRRMQLSTVPFPVWSPTKTPTPSWPQMAVAAGTAVIEGNLWMFGGGTCPPTAGHEGVTACDLTVYVGGVLLQLWGSLNNTCGDALWVYQVRSNTWQEVRKPIPARGSLREAYSWPTGQCEAEIEGSSTAAGRHTRTQLRLLQPGWVRWPERSEVVEMVGNSVPLLGT